MNSKKPDESSKNLLANESDELKTESDSNSNEKIAALNQSKKKISWKRIVKTGGIIILCAIILGAIFISGIEIGKSLPLR